MRGGAVCIQPPLPTWNKFKWHLALVNGKRYNYCGKTWRPEHSAATTPTAETSPTLAQPCLRHSAAVSMLALHWRPAPLDVMNGLLGDRRLVRDVMPTLAMSIGKSHAGNSSADSVIHELPCPAWERERHFPEHQPILALLERRKLAD